MTVLGDPNAMTTAELRSARANLQMQEDVISFVRRMAQGRCDLARDEQRRRVDGTPGKSLFAKIDALTTELVKRYKDGGANVETLLTD
ncbi:MAG: hypothetical protein EB028_02270 [Actinobacteria bacterium]|nr:hypothetical protein [Actinomycetota bacterium]